MNPHNLNIYDTNHQVEFLAMVRERILAGEPILKPVEKGQALLWIDMALADGCSVSTTRKIAREEAQVAPGFRFFRTLDLINRSKATLDDLIRECFLTPAVPDGLGIAPLLVPVVSVAANYAAKFITDLFGERPKGTFFTWSAEEQRTFVNNSFKEAFLGNYDCSLSPRVVAYALLREALKGDAKHEDPAFFLNDWWFAKGYDWAGNLSNSYNINIDDRSKDASGNPRKCNSASGSGGTSLAGMGLWLALGLAGIGVTALFVLLGSNKNDVPKSAINVKNEDIEAVKKQFQPKEKLK